VKYFARKYKDSVVPGSNISSKHKPETGRWTELFIEDCCSNLSFVAEGLRYFVRKNNKGEVIDGSLVSKKHRPRTGRWSEMFYDTCCESVNAKYVGFYGVPYVEPYIPSILQPSDTRDLSGVGKTFTEIFTELSSTNAASSVIDTETQYSEWFFSIVYSDSTGLSKTTIHRIENYTALDLQNYTKFWLDTVIKPLVPTFNSVIEGDKIKIDAFDREVWVSLGNPIQVFLTVDYLPSVEVLMQYTFNIKSIYNDYEFELGPFGRVEYPGSFIMIPYFSTWDIELKNVVPNTLQQSVILNLFGNSIAPITVPVGGEDFEFLNIPSFIQNVVFTTVDD
jgi:hypothetical protein